MVNFNVGDVVTRISYGMDMLFRIEKIEDEVADLKGLFFRLTATAPLSDLVMAADADIRGAKKEEASYMDQFLTLDARPNMRSAAEDFSDFYLSGRVLHVDGDQDYLERSERLYEKAGVYATTVFVKEPLMPEAVPDLVRDLRPNIVVITGHDAIEDKSLIDKLEGYRSSKYFVKTVHELRKLEPALDYLIIVAGACQSHFEALIGTGANFASSPKRINIHALDPAIIAATVALTPYEDEVDLKAALEKTVTKIAGIGGLQTRGTLRYGIREESED